MPRVLPFLILVAGGGFALLGFLQLRLAAVLGPVEEDPPSREDVAYVLPSASDANAIRLSAPWLDREEGSPDERTERLGCVLRFESLALGAGGRLRLVRPRLTIQQRPDVAFELTAAHGLVEAEMDTVLFRGDVVAVSSDGETRTRLFADRVLCHVRERRARSEGPIRIERGASKSGPDLVVTGIGLTADLELGRYEIDREGRIDLVSHGGRLAAGEAGEAVHMECRGRLLVERTAGDGSTGIPTYRVTLRDRPIVARGGSTLSARQVVHLRASGSGRLDHLRAVEGVEIVEATRDGRSEATGDHFVWKRLPDGREEAILRYEPRLTLERAGERWTVAGYDRMELVRRPAGEGGEVRETATFSGGVEARGEDAVLACEHLEVDLGGSSRRVRAARAIGEVRFSRADLEARADRLEWDRRSPTEDVVALSGDAPRLSIRDVEGADLRIACRDRIVHVRRTRPEGAGPDVPDPDDTLEAHDRVEAERIRLDGSGRPRADRAPATLEARERLAIVLAARAGGDPRVRRLEALGRVRVVDAGAGATADRLVHEADSGLSTLDLSGRARAWSPDGFVEGDRIRTRREGSTLRTVEVSGQARAGTSDGFVEGEGLHHRLEESAEGTVTTDEFVVHGAPGRPAVVWRPVEDGDPGRPPAERHRLEAEEIRHDRLTRRAIATGRAFCRVHVAEGPDVPRTPWVFKARRIEATFAPEDPGRPRPSIERLEGIGDVHVYCAPAGGQTREGRAHGFEYLAPERKVRLAADPGDPNDRVQVWRGEEWIRSRRIDVAGEPGAEVVRAEEGGVVHLVPSPRDAVEIECRGPISFDRRASRIRFEQGVRVAQGRAEFRTRILEAILDPETGRARRAIGTGEVMLVMEGNTGQGDRIEWDVAARRGTLTGTPQARVRSGDGEWVSGRRIQYELDGERVIVDGQPMAGFDPERRDR